MSAVPLDESLWDAVKHPRGRAGKWIDSAGGGITSDMERAAEEMGKRLERPVIQRKEPSLPQTEAFRRGLRNADYMTRTGTHGDEFMYDLAVDHGFSGRPKVVNEAELQKLIDDGDKELWRGVSDESYAQKLTTGTLFYGQGFRGNGIYAASGGRAQTMAKSYAQAPPTRGVAAKADKPVVVHMALAREAKTVDYEEAASKARNESLKHAETKGGGEGTARALDVLSLANNSATRWALANGFDAVIVPQADGSDEVVVLNRTALIVSSEFAAAGTNVARQARVAA